MVSFFKIFFFLSKLVIFRFIEAHTNLKSALITTIRKLNSGYINGARVQLGNMKDFIKTSCLTNLTFIGTEESGKGEIS